MRAVSPIRPNSPSLFEGIIAPESVRVTPHGTVGTYEDGEPHGDWRFEVSARGRQLLTIYAGVNIIKNDRRVGRDTFYVVDINAHENADLAFQTTNSYGAYAQGVRLGPAVMRAVLRQILGIVRKDFPGVRRIEGGRLTGARMKKPGSSRQVGLDLPSGID